MSGIGSLGQNEVIRASAGSGKTFRLTNRYLALILSGVEPETILATTFTRKAAGEILDRIFQRLARAALIEEERQTLSEQLFGSESHLSRDMVLSAVEKMTRRLHRLRVMTLDAYFSNIAGGFAPELGLPVGWRIVEPVENARNLLRAVLVALSAPDRPATLGLLHLLFQGNLNRSLAKEIYDLALEMLPLGRVTDPSVWFALQRLKMPDDAEVRLAIEQLRDAPLPRNKSTKSAKSDANASPEQGEPNGNFLRERNRLVAAAENGDWDSFAQGRLVGSLLDGTKTYCRKPVEEELAAPILALIEVVRTIIVNRTADRTESTRRMLDQVAEQFERVKRENQEYRFDDIAIFLAERLRAVGQDQLAYRTDVGTRFLLLDEFQDTSILQWTILRPLVQSLMSGKMSRSQDADAPEAALFPKRLRLGTDSFCRS